MTKVFRFVAICVIGVALPVFSIASAQDLYDYRLSKCGYDHSKPRSQSAGYQRRQLHRHIQCYSRFQR
jgi:hypothetical protein